MMKVFIDEDICRGHGVCAAECPAVFGISDDGYGEVLVDEVPADLEAEVRTVSGHCPERAITVE
ncbi:ferredoxin [Pseudofrankia sp. BMG5.37]|nr:ferredoxin [Pseudofrankia sp. BMG5.37]